MSHTPGPWNACGEKRGGCSCGHVFGDNGQVFVAHAFGPQNIKDVDPVPSTAEMQVANARLIAAAPDLLEGCEAMLADLAETACVSVQEFAANSEIGEAALAAIAKAKDTA